MSGLFISFEGNDGAGKSTQAALLLDSLRKKGISAVSFREPGGTDISEKIREIILDNENYKMKYMTEALLYAASRCQLVGEKILPALKAGNVVICDRFLDSSVVYQGVGRNLGIDTIEEINRFATGGLKPDLTFFLHLEPSEGIERKRSDGELDRMENQKGYFFWKVYNGFMELAERENERIIKIEANRPPNEIAAEIEELAERFIAERGL